MLEVTAETTLKEFVTDALKEMVHEATGVLHFEIPVDVEPESSDGEYREETATLAIAIVGLTDSRERSAAGSDEEESE